MTKPRLLPGFLGLLAMVLVAWAYWPGLSGPALLDDSANLMPLDRLGLSEAYAVDVATGNRSGPYGRPLAMASFVLERLYLDYGLRGQKTVGLVLHLLCGGVLCLLARRLSRHIGLESDWTAVAVAALWLSQPLLLSTTLYVVQRMTLLSALFCLCAMYAYVSGRCAQHNGGYALTWFLLCFVATTLSALAKENGLLTLPLLTLLEVFFFRFQSVDPSRKQQLYGLHIAFFVVPLLAFIAVVGFRPDFLFNGYAVRDFTMLQRLASQSVVLFEYLQQLAWVDVGSLGVYHDDVLAPAGLASATVLMAVAGWAGLASIAAYAAVSGRFLMPGFAIAFFMVAHGMESTVFPLELYFEHRNYLPATGLMLGAGFASAQCSRRWTASTGIIVLGLILLLSRNILLLGSQAFVWSDDRLLHIEAVVNHPKSERAALELARVLAQDGNLQGALNLLANSRQYAARSDAEERLLQAVFHCIAKKPHPQRLLEDIRVDRDELASVRVNNAVQHLTQLSLADLCLPEDARAFADAMRVWMRTDHDPQGTPRLYGNLLLLENKLQRYEVALLYAKLLTQREPDNAMGLQFRLYLATRLDLAEEREQARAELIRLRDLGALTRQEAANLALFNAGNDASTTDFTIKDSDTL
ncbi:MAG: hypothetical protein AAGI24_05365 [Pseudomonadota bacterium]